MKWRLYWANARESGCFSVEATCKKDVLFLAVQAGIPSLDWLEVWFWQGDRWHVEKP